MGVCWQLRAAVGGLIASAAGPLLAAPQCPDPGDLPLQSLLFAAGIEPRKPLTELEGPMKRMRGKHCLSFTVVHRPARRGEEGIVLEINPHLRPDVHVSERHDVVLYVGVNPLAPMPPELLEGWTLGDARRRLAAFGIQAAVRCSGTRGVSTAPDDAVVVVQSPPPGALLGRKAEMSGFEMPQQYALLVVACGVPAPPPSPPQSIATEADACPQPDVLSFDKLLGGATAGMAGTLLLTRLLRQGGQAVPLPGASSSAPRPSLRVRVRHDRDPSPDR